MNVYKRLLILIIFIFGLTGCGYIAPVTKIKSGKDITFYITTDIHFLARDLTDDGEAFQKFINSGSGMQLNYIEEIVDAFSNDIKKKKPDVLIISGDLTTNGEKKSHLKLSEKLESIEKEGTSVYVIPGNHDILNPYAREFKGDKQYRTEYIDDKDFIEIYQNFGYRESISKDNQTLSYLVAPSEDIWLLMLDTNQYKNNLSLGYPQGDGMIPPETFEWIKKSADLAKENNAQIITVMHQNLLDHSDTVKKGYTLNNNKDAIEIFQNYGIDLVLSGHIHRQDIKSHNKGEDVIYDIATSALSVYPQKYGVLKYSPTGVYDYSTSRVDVEGWSKEIGIIEKNINNFNEYSKNFLGNQLYNMGYDRLEKMGKYSDEEIDLMAETSKIIRLRYFEGMENVLTDEILNSQGFNLWKENSSGSLYSSIMRMAYSNNMANNKLQISTHKKEELGNFKKE